MQENWAILEVAIRLKKKKSCISCRVIEMISHKKDKTRNIIKKNGKLSQVKFQFEKEKPFLRQQ